MADALLRIEGLGKRYGAVEALARRRPAGAAR